MGLPTMVRSRPSARPTRDFSGGHLLASLGAPQAGGDALLHAFELLTARRACPADLGALAADMLVVLGPAHHEVERYAANMRAIHHQLEAIGLGVLTTCFQALAHGHREAGPMAGVASVNALLHFR